MSLAPIKNVGFTNQYWKEEWGVWVPGMENKQKYADGNYTVENDGTIHIFDGATNFRGDILPNGNLCPNDNGSDALVREMNMSFLKAVTELVK